MEAGSKVANRKADDYRYKPYRIVERFYRPPPHRDSCLRHCCSIGMSVFHPKRTLGIEHFVGERPSLGREQFQSFADLQPMRFGLGEIRGDLGAAAA